MKAVRVHTYGGPEVLTYEDVPDPTPGPGEVVVETEIIAINFSDTHYRSGSSQASPLPVTPGHEGIGRVAALGEGATRFKVGDRVAYTGQHHLGTYKELMLIPEKDVLPVPAGIDSKLAVAALNQGQTAHYLVHEARPLQKGDRILVHAAAGGVGSNMVQMAKMMGATVYATVSSDEKAAFVRDLGAEDVCVYTRDDFEAAVKTWTDGEGMDVVFDAVAGEVLPKSLRCLKRKGHLVSYGASGGPAAPIQWPVRGIGSYFMSYHTGQDYSRPGPETTARAHEIFRWIREGQLRVHIHKEYALADAAQAHLDLESRKTMGRLLLIP